MRKVLLTGAAGFIGYHVFRRLQQENIEVVGLDNLNNYYDVSLKMARLVHAGFELTNIAYGRMVESSLGGRFIQLNMEDSAAVAELFYREKFDAVCHLAAQAGVRFSVENPLIYMQSNINGFVNILEGCRKSGVEHLIYASSSSVYGNTAKIPFSEDEPLEIPASIYAVTKQNNETMAGCYSKLYGINAVGLRFFTVYGPWGRPDMALFKFTKAILTGTPIDVYNFGDMQRDFTYIDDIVEGIVRIMQKVSGDAAFQPENLYNIGNGHPVGLLDFIHSIEEATGKKAVLNFLPLQKGDVYRTWANTDKLKRDFDFEPNVPLAEGVKNFVSWYQQFYNKPLCGGTV